MDGRGIETKSLRRALLLTIIQKKAADNRLLFRDLKIKLNQKA